MENNCLTGWECEESRDIGAFLEDALWNRFHSIYLALNICDSSEETKADDDDVDINTIGNNNKYTMMVLGRTFCEFTR